VEDVLELTHELPEHLVSEPIAHQAASHFNNLFAAVQDSRGMPLGSAHRTLEDLVKELLKPLLRDWLDQHLASIVQRAVEREVGRLTSRGEDDPPRY
jgi:cell pole-organizing protein PopZ